MKRVVNYLVKRDALGATLVLAVVLLVFFGRAIFTGGYFAPGDIIRIFAPFADGFKAHNSLLSDPLVQFLPWFKLSGGLIGADHFPLWNIFSGGGLPLMANMQSQVLWPLSIFIYLFNFKVGLTLYAAGKLLVIGLFTYLYLREIKIAKSIALTGAIGFMLAGFNIVWLMWPHTNEIFLLPLGFYLVERYFRTYDLKLLLWFSLGLAIGVFGGHPETFFHVVVAIAIYIVFKLATQTRDWKDFLSQGVRWLIAGLLGVGLSAVLLLPFIEYLGLSQALADRGAQVNPYFLSKIGLVLNFIPDFFGNPALGDRYYLTAANFNYNETTMAYVGITLAFLALYALMWHWRDRLVKFFVLLSAFCFGVIYHFPVIFPLITKLPVFHTTANHRLAVVFAFGLVVLGAIAIQHLMESGISRKKILTTSLVFLAGVTITILYAHYRGPDFVQAGQDLGRMSQWQLIFIGLFVVNFALMLAALIWAPPKHRLGLVMLLVFVETGVHGAIYNTVSSDDNFYPDSPTTQYLSQEFPKGYYKTFTGEGILLPPNLGAWYGFDHLNDNDAVGLKTYADLKAGIGTLVPGWETYAEPTDLKPLAFLGAKYLVFAPDRGRAILATHPEVKTAFEDNQTMILTQPALPRAYFVKTKEVLPLLLKNPDPSQVTAAQSYQLALNGSEQIEITSNSDGYLILNENYYPGWQATLNGHPVTIEDAMGLRAIPVQAGENKIQTTYKPRSFKLGIDITLISLAIWLGTLAWIRKRKL